MSPRSEEFIAEARDALAASRSLLEGGFYSRAVSAAYYAMLYAARAALSERELYAKTHKGTWDLFWREYAEPGSLDRGLATEARRTQAPREGVDYEALRIEPADARRITEVAGRFPTAVEQMLGA